MAAARAFAMPAAVAAARGDTGGGGSHRVFVYGTLMAEEVLRPLVGRVPVRRVGTIFGFSRGCVRGEAFPAVLRTGADDQVEGLLIEDLLPRELRALDYYASRRHSNREPCEPAGSVHPA